MRNLSDEFLLFYARGYKAAVTGRVAFIKKDWDEEKRVAYKEGYDRGIHEWFMDDIPDAEYEEV